MGRLQRAAIALVAFAGFAAAVTPAFADPRYRIVDLGTLGGHSSGGVGNYGTGINAGGEVTGQSLTTGNAAEHAFLYNRSTMVDLGTLGGADSTGSAINDKGEVAGVSYTTGNATQHAFLFSGSTMVDLGTLPGGTFSGAQGINDRGEVTGGSSTAAHPGYVDAFLYKRGVMQDLNLQDNLFGGGGFGINDSGEVTGCCYRGSTYAFLYKGTTTLDLGTLTGYSSSVGLGINA